jgi:hypothetical protein
MLPDCATSRLIYRLASSASDVRVIQRYTRFIVGSPILCYIGVAREAAAKAQSMNSRASALRSNRYVPNPSSSYIARPSAWSSSVSYRCVHGQSKRLQWPPQQEAVPVVVLAAPTPPLSPIPVPLIESVRLSERLSQSMALRVMLIGSHTGCTGKHAEPWKLHCFHPG